MDTRTVVIYHADCRDGIAAAWAAWRRLGDDNVEYIPMGYHEPRRWELFAGARVYFVDFSWPRADLEALATVAAEVTVLDHHKTAQAALADIPPDAPGRCRITVVFDMSKCGARLSWEHFHPGRADQPPSIIWYVQDRDLWRWELPDSKAISAALGTYPLTIRDFDRAADLMCVDPMMMRCVGERVLAMQQIMVEAMCRRSYMAIVAGHRVPCCNVPAATMLQSEVGEYLCHQHPEAPFAAVYYDTDARNRGWSLRSRPDKDGVSFDVSAVAKVYGGGGHHQAAGFSTLIDAWPYRDLRPG